ncbi:hypothetical protein PInf_015876 [Phytophthora infestans]|nr:hypothetical protein PInf_015876 [Phytophthora infestans]
MKQANIVVSLLQPPPEVFNLFDDILIMNDGRIMYHGPREQVQEYGDIESGALRAGGVPSIWSLRNIGVLVSFCCVTIVYGMSLSILYAVMNNYLYMSGLLVATARALVRIPRVLRVFLSAFSDIYPIFGYRRRPYMIIGWSIAFIALVSSGVLRSK